MTTADDRLLAIRTNVERNRWAALWPVIARQLRKLKALSLVLAFVFSTFLAGTVAAHEITAVDVVCEGEGQGITASGKLFGENLPITVTLTGTVESGYVETYEVTTDDWTHTFPLGPNGHYQLDWPGSGNFGPVPLLVDCAVPAPSETPRPTPSVVGSPPPSNPVTSPPPSLLPRPTPPQTSTADATDVVADGTSGAIVFVAAVGLLLILHGLLTAGAKALGIKLPEDRK